MSDFSEFHDELRAVAREVLGAAEPGAPVDWRALAGAGWWGLEIPEELGGAGATFAETAVVAGELGRALAASAFLGSGVLATGLLLMANPGPGRDELLRSAAAGDSRLAVVVGAGELPHAGTAWHLRSTGGRLELSGRADFVPDASEADRLLVLASTPTGDPAVVAVAADRSGLTVTRQMVVDPTRSLASVQGREVEVEPDAVWPLGVPWGPALASVTDRASLAVACDALAVAEQVMERTVAYVGQRHQFGRPIGSFQAVKHACADMYVEVAVGHRLVEAAVEACCPAGPDSWMAVAQAKSHVTEAAVSVAGKAMQLHGGIGYTWESGIHLYLKRATLDRTLFGSPADHRRRLATRFV